MKLPENLRPKQLMAMEHIYGDDFRNVILAQPTGYGKTIQAMMAMDRVITEGHRVIYASPMKALTAEQSETFGKEWNVKEITGETEDIQYTAEFLEQFNVFIFTYEKLFSMMKKENTRDLFFDDLDVDLVVIDEVHMIGDESRGSNLEKLLMVLMTLHPLVHLLGLSATIGNVDKVAKFLGNSHVIYAGNDERPVPLNVEIIKIPKIYGGKKKFIFKMMNHINDIINSHKGDKTLIFWSSQERSVNAAKMLAGIGERKLYGKMLVDELVKKHVSYHNASLAAPTRKMIEDSFRHGDIDVISSTTTLAVGVNTPARRAIIADVSRWNWVRTEEELLKPSEFHQMLGRAGRPGFDKIGYGVIICDAQYYDAVSRIINGNMIVESQMGNNIDSHILDFVTSFIDNKETLEQLMLIGLDPPSPGEIKDALKWLVEKRFIAEENNGLRSTFIGKMTSYAFILPRTALHILSVDKQVDPSISKENEFVALFDKVLNVEEFLNSIVVRENDNDNLAISIASKIYKFSDSRIAKAFSFLFSPFLSRKGLLTEVEEKMVLDAKGIQDSSLRICRAASMLCPKNKRIYTVLEMMIESGYIDTKMVDLFKIRGIGIARLDRLSKAGIDTVEKFMNTPTKELAMVLGVSIQTAGQMKSDTRRE